MSTLYTTEYLAHYGVKGMKWGIRHDRKATGKRGKTVNSLSGKAARAGSAVLKGLRIAAPFAATVATALGAAPFGASLLVGGAISGVSYFGGKAIAKYGRKTAEAESEADKNMKILKKDPSEHYSMKDDYIRVNPGYKNSSFDVNSTNCPFTTMAYELRRRGYDVKARSLSGGETVGNILKMYNISTSDKSLAIFKQDVSNPLSVHVNKKQVDSTLSNKDIYPDNSRGFVECTWKPASGSLQSDGGGHIFNWEKTNGEIHYIDAQSGKEVGNNYFNKMKSCMIARTDDKTINMNEAYKWVSNV